jgi:hypothetical protein
MTYPVVVPIAMSPRGPTAVRFPRFPRDFELPGHRGGTIRALYGTIVAQARRARQPSLASGRSERTFGPRRAGFVGLLTGTVDFPDLDRYILGGLPGLAEVIEMSASGPAWNVPVRVEEISVTGQHFALTADPATRAGLARAAGLLELPRLEATFAVTRRGRYGVHVAGTVCATVRQTCVVTLEPVESEIEEAVDLTFLEKSGRSGASAQSPADEEVPPGVEDPSEPLVDGTVDLGAIATEFLMLGIDPYPRKPGALFAAPASKEDHAHPFDALAVLKKRDG